MSHLLNGRELTKSYGTEPLFSGLSLGIAAGERLAIMGANGAGKSTLLKILAGVETPDQGEVVTRKGIRVVYVPQTRVFAPQESVLSVVRQGAESLPNFESTLYPLLGMAGFEDPEIPALDLSGGWQKRLMLVWGLAQQPDILLLDEPTNHLDIQGTLWLEDLLGAATFTWVVISHDRMFIERTATKTAELGNAYEGGMVTVDGGYRTFLEHKKQYIQSRTQYREALKNKVARETAWLQKSPKARTTKSRARVDGALRLAEELDEVKQSLRTTEIQVDFTASGRKTKRLVTLKSVSFSFDDQPIVRDLDLLLTPKLRLGLLGDNGSGKSTVLSLLSGARTPQAGDVRFAPDLQCVVCDQHREQLDMNWTLKQALSETGDSVIYRDRSTHVASWAKRFGFHTEQLPVPLHMLSGGEQARLLIARLMLRPADVLLLDEPTNDLDLPTLEVLEESLLDFQGALVVVSHDRYLLERVCHRFVALDGSGGWAPYASYGQWERQLSSSRETKEKPQTTPTREKTQQRTKLSYNDQREWETIEARILEAEQQLALHRTVANDPAIASNGPQLEIAFANLKDAESRVERLYERWSELDSMQNP
ncbi:MAG: ABC-F family ATP-binding cassette domain-containing protein [Acidobacteria bacterium]|nr:ABC-F family ATP-binding cassette domain-containing protein [Acidobacteriota bacterium]